MSRTRIAKATFYSDGNERGRGGGKVTQIHKSGRSKIKREIFMNSHSEMLNSYLNFPFFLGYFYTYMSVKFDDLFRLPSPPLRPPIISYK